MTRARNGNSQGISRCLTLWGGLVGWCAAGCGQAPLPPPPSQSHETTPQTTVPVRPVPVVPLAKNDKPPPKVSDSVVLKPIADPPARAPRAIQVEKLTPIKGPGDVGQIITALARDHLGNVWVGTEERGVLRHSPKNEWTRFTAHDGLGDDYAHAICEDGLGRIWVGHRNHGVSVFNGETWKNYDVLTGPLGERVFDIQCSPVDGDVWIATCLGLARYSETNRRWSYFTRADG